MENIWAKAIDADDGGANMTSSSVMERIEKPWGYELILALTDTYCVKILHLEPNQRTSLQYHERKLERMQLMSGTVQVEHNNRIINRELWQTAIINPGDIHRLTAGDDGADVLEASTPELDDVVRLVDDYGRV